MAPKRTRKPTPLSIMSPLMRSKQFEAPKGAQTHSGDFSKLQDSQISSIKGSRRYKTFKRQEWENSPGANLVINRKSLNKEQSQRV